MIALWPNELLAIIDYFEMVDALVEADDGTLVPHAEVERHYQFKEVLDEIVERYSEGPRDPRSADTV